MGTLLLTLHCSLLTGWRYSWSTYILKMTYCADSNKFIKDLLDAKYKKIEESITEMEQNAEILVANPDDATAHQKERFQATARSLELVETKEVDQLYDTLIMDMPDKEKDLCTKEHDSLLEKLAKALLKCKEVKGKLKL